MHPETAQNPGKRSISIREAEAIRDRERDSSLFYDIYGHLKTWDSAGEEVLGDPFDAMQCAYSDGTKGFHDDAEPRSLPLCTTEWKTTTPAGNGAAVLQREIDFESESTGIPPNIDGSEVRNLVETMVPFPSAPIHGVQRMHMFNRRSTIPYSEAFHAIRVIKPVGASGAPSRIFLLHNGLNETDSMGRYYQLAARLCAEIPPDRQVSPGEYNACIICPFPGHLTREAYKQFATKPLDRYLWDGSHLFRQFLRSMVETRWLLSMIVRRSQYLLPSGTTLLLEKEEIAGSRLEAEALSKAMFEDYEAMRKASNDSLNNASQESSREAGFARGVSPAGDLAHIRRCVEVLRAELGLTEDVDTLYNSDVPSAEDREPSIHVIGYSLGGFVAHSVFMTWPWAVDSCTSLMSGGNLRSLTPTLFAFAEEWQTVLHSLRYELDEGLLAGRFGTHKESRIAGIEANIFRYFKRTFYEVFQQDYRGGYLSRAGELSNRMRHFVGGRDNIVQSSAVFDSAPPGGLNVRTIADLDHFMGGRFVLDEEWFVEVCTEIRTLTAAAAEAQRKARSTHWMTADLEFREETLKEAGLGEHLELAKPLTEPERLAIPKDGSLDEKYFGRSLDDLLHRQTGSSSSSGHLFILRNEVPGLLLTPHELIESAAIMHYDDAQIVSTGKAVLRRQRMIREECENTHLILPWNALHTMKTVDEYRGFPSQGEGAWGQLQNADQDYSAERLHCIERCHELNALAADRGVSVRLFSGNNRPQKVASENEKFDEFWRSDGIDALESVAEMPDCWIWCSNEFLKNTQADGLVAEDVRSLGFEHVVELLLSAVTRATADPPESDGHRLTRKSDPVFDRIDRALRTDQLRVISVSKSRYNPRHRGHIVAHSKRAWEVLAHACLCMSMSRSIGDGVHPIDSTPFGQREWDWPATGVARGEALTAQARLLNRIRSANESVADLFRPRKPRDPGPPDA